MPICWFDMPRNSGSSVAGRLSVDSQLVNGLTSLLFAVMLHNLATIVAAFVISFIYSWRVGIVGLVVMPLMLLAGFISMKFYGGFGDKSEEVYKLSSRLVSESVMNIKTVKALAY
jgi:ABC-type multidrug transport system fused ATPase/permease subunit